MSAKKVSIIVVTWNGKDYLKMCLSSLKKLTYSNYEVVVVDNASEDDSQNYVKKHHPWVKLINAHENLGYVGGNNLGIANADGDYIFILNNDVEVEPDFLSILVKRLESDLKIGCVQPKLVEHTNRDLLDSVGHFLTDMAFLYHYGRLKQQDLGIYNQSMEIYSAKGAAMLLRRSAIEKIGGAFDPDFFIYFEETDMCHRLWLAGYKVVYEPEAVIYHVVAGDTSKQFKSSRTLYLSLRNRICSFIKTYEPANLAKMLTVLLVTYFGLMIYYLLTLKFSLAWAIIRGLFWNIIHLNKTLKKREFVQGLRKVSDQELFKKLKRNPQMKYYYYLLRNRLGEYQDLSLA